MQQQQPGEFISGASIARDRRNRGANRRSSDTVILRQSSSNSRLPKVALIHDSFSCAIAAAHVVCQAVQVVAEDGSAVESTSDTLGVTGVAVQASSQLSTAGVSCNASCVFHACR